MSTDGTEHELEYHWMCPYCENPHFGDECEHNTVPANKLILAIEDGTRLAEEHDHDVRYVHTGTDRGDE